MSINACFTKIQMDILKTPYSQTCKFQGSITPPFQLSLQCNISFIINIEVFGGRLINWPQAMTDCSHSSQDYWLQWVHTASTQDRPDDQLQLLTCKTSATPLTAADIQTCAEHPARIQSLHIYHIRQVQYLIIQFHKNSNNPFYSTNKTNILRAICQTYLS